jgi:hypothetical protein
LVGKVGERGPADSLPRTTEMGVEDLEAEIRAVRLEWRKVRRKFWPGGIVKYW